MCPTDKNFQKAALSQDVIFEKQ